MYEDATGFLVRGVLMDRDEGDKGVAVRETKSLQEMFNDGVERLSFRPGPNCSRIFERLGRLNCRVNSQHTLFVIGLATVRRLPRSTTLRQQMTTSTWLPPARCKKRCSQMRKVVVMLRKSSHQRIKKAVKSLVASDFTALQITRPGLELLPETLGKQHIWWKAVQNPVHCISKVVQIGVKFDR